MPAASVSRNSRDRGSKGGHGAGPSNAHPVAKARMTVEQESLLLQVREVGITEENMTDEEVLFILHDNGENVANLVSNFYDGTYQREPEALEFTAGGKKDKRKKKDTRHHDEPRQPKWQAGPAAKPAPRPPRAEQRPASQRDSLPRSTPAVALPRPSAQAPQPAVVSNGRGWGAPSVSHQPEPPSLVEHSAPSSVPAPASNVSANVGGMSWANRAAAGVRKEEPPPPPQPAIPAPAPIPAPVPAVKTPPSPGISSSVLVNGTHEAPSAQQDPVVEPTPPVSEISEPMDHFPIPAPPSPAYQPPPQQAGWGATETTSNGDLSHANLSAGAPFQVSDTGASAPASIYAPYATSTTASQAAPQAPVIAAASALAAEAPAIRASPFPTAMPPGSYGSYSGSGLAGAGFMESLPQYPAKEQPDQSAAVNSLNLQFGTLGLGSATSANGSGLGEASAQMGAAQPLAGMGGHVPTLPSAMPMPGGAPYSLPQTYAGMPQYGAGGAFGAASGEASLRGARQGGMYAGYGGEEQYGYGAAPVTSEAGPTSAATAPKGSAARGGQGYRGGSGGDGKQAQQAGTQQPQAQPAPMAGQPQHPQMPYYAHQMYPQQYMYPQGAQPFYGFQSAAGFPAQAAQYAQQQKNMGRPGTMPQHSGFPAQGAAYAYGGGYGAAMPAGAPATMGGYEGFAGYDGTGYPQEQPPASAGGASADSKSQQEIQHMAASGFQQQQYGAGAYPQQAYGQYGGYPQAAPQVAPAAAAAGYGQPQHFAPAGAGWQAPPDQPAR